MDRGERRNKGKDKGREKKKHPYKSGGQFRTWDSKSGDSKKDNQAKN